MFADSHGIKIFNAGNMLKSGAYFQEIQVYIVTHQSI